MFSGHAAAIDASDLTPSLVFCGYVCSYCEGPARTHLEVNRPGFRGDRCAPEYCGLGLLEFMPLAVGRLGSFHTRSASAS